MEGLSRPERQYHSTSSFYVLWIKRLLRVTSDKFSKDSLTNDNNMPMVIDVVVKVGLVVRVSPIEKASTTNRPHI